MTARLTEELAQILGISGDSARAALESLVERIKDDIETSGEARVEGLGVFRGSKEGIEFQPDDDVVLLANRQYEGFEPVVVTRPFGESEPVPETELSGEEPIEPGDDVSTVAEETESAGASLPVVGAVASESADEFVDVYGKAPSTEEEQWEVGRAIDDLFSLDLDTREAPFSVHTPDASEPPSPFAPPLEEDAEPADDVEAVHGTEEVDVIEEVGAPDLPTEDDDLEMAAWEEPISGGVATVLTLDSAEDVPPLAPESAVPVQQAVPVESLDHLATPGEGSGFSESPPVPSRSRRRRRRRSSSSGSHSPVVRRQKRAYVIGMSILTAVALLVVVWFLWTRFGAGSERSRATETAAVQTQSTDTPTEASLPAVAESIQEQAAGTSETPSAESQAEQPASTTPEPVEQPAAARPDPVAATASDVPFAWIVASVPGRTEAESSVATLRSSGYDASFVPATVNGQTRYRIAIGGYPTRADALGSRNDLPPGSTDAWVTRVR